MLYIDRVGGGLLQHPFTHGGDEVVHIAIDGTHSSGQTTLKEDFLDARELTTPEDFDFGPTIRSRANQVFPFYGVIERVDGLAVPVVVASEVARQYDAWHPGEEVLTTGYNQYDQAAISLRAFGTVQSASILAGAYARRLQPEASTRVSAIITERTGLSGFVYSDTALPDENHDMLDLELNATIDGLAMANRGAGVINLRRWVTELTTYCDAAAITDHTEVRFEDDGKRKTDLQFRENIATGVVAAYSSVIGAENVHRMSGSPSVRQSKLTGLLRHAIRARLQTISA